MTTLHLQTSEFNKNNNIDRLADLSLAQHSSVQVCSFVSSAFFYFCGGGAMSDFCMLLIQLWKISFEQGIQ